MIPIRMFRYSELSRKAQEKITKLYMQKDGELPEYVKESYFDKENNLHQLINGVFVLLIKWGDEYDIYNK